MSAPAHASRASASSYADFIRILGAAAIAGLVIAAYWPSITGGFIWDDDTLLTKNALVKAPGGLWQMWFTTRAPDYWPVSNSSLWLEWRLWGEKPVGYHLTNLLMHIACSIFVWRILAELRIPGAYFGALLFAIHPVNVESVAWIAQRKTLLAMLFFLVSLWFFLKFDDHSKDSNDAQAKRRAILCYAAALIAFLFAMLSKGSVAMLPLVLLFIIRWRHLAVSKADIVGVAPFFATSALLVAVNIWFQTHGSGEIIRDATLWERIAAGGAVIWFYLSKAFLPINLMFVYPQWTVDTARVLWWLPLVAAFVLTVALIWKRNKGMSRHLLFAWLYFVFALVPVLGLVDVYFMRYSLVADHYQYIAIPAAAALVATILTLWIKNARSTFRLLPIAASVALITVLWLHTESLCQTYTDAVTLWRTALRQNPSSWMVYNNLGMELTDQQQYSEAIDCFRQAIHCKPDILRAYGNLADVFIKTRRFDEAIQTYRDYLKLEPKSAEAWNNLGSALKRAGRLVESLVAFRTAIEIQPNFSLAHNNLSSALMSLGRTNDAADHLQRVMPLISADADAHANLGTAFFQLGRVSDAIEQYRESLRLGESANVHYDLANALMGSGQTAEAMDHYRLAIKRNPDFAEAHNNFGAALVNEGNADQAFEHFAIAVELKPDYNDAWRNLVQSLPVLERIPRTMNAAERALSCAKQSGQSAIATEIRNWLNAASSPAATRSHSE